VTTPELNGPDFSKDGDAAFSELELEEMPAQECIEAVIKRSVDMRASDLFLLAEEKSYSIKIRTLGDIKRIAMVSTATGRQLVNTMKVASGMNISDSLRPGDGRMLFEAEGLRIDIRLNTIPSLFGEDMTCRMLDRSASLISLDEIGLEPDAQDSLSNMLNSRSGLILVTGPTGTGKTTTLYACLRYLNTGEKKINTLEDPVEYALKGVCQSQISPRLGVNFHDLLPNVLRQSPDVIMIGEIRDEETAATAVRAANSGHLVLATLHAPVAAGAIQSMLALGSQPYFLASSLLGVIAQRLIRVLCVHCRVGYDISSSPGTFGEIQQLLKPGEGNEIFGPSGCEECFGGGYSGRTGLFELMSLNREVRRMVAEARPLTEIQDAVIRGGMIEFHRAALLKVARGVTSTEEMMSEVPTEYLGLEE